jgi:hypothetical protein
MFSFEHFLGNQTWAGNFSPRPMRFWAGVDVSELPLIVIEDEYVLQGVVEDALTEGGFDSDILSSGEEALTLFKGRLIGRSSPMLI